MKTLLIALTFALSACGVQIPEGATVAITNTDACGEYIGYRDEHYVLRNASDGKFVSIHKYNLNKVLIEVSDCQ